MNNIGIVGTGIAGLQLGLFLQQRGIPTTIYTDRTPEQQRGGRILNNVVRFGHTREREHALGIKHWDVIGPDLTSVSLAVGGEHPLGFVGHLSRPASYVDMRLYQASAAARIRAVDLRADRPAQLWPDTAARLAPRRDHADGATGLCQARQW